MTWPALLAAQMSLAFVGACTYLSFTGHWLLWALLFGGYVGGGLTHALEQAHRKLRASA